MPEIVLDGVYTGYGKVEVLSDLNLKVYNPGAYVVLGKNGAGKTTLLRTLSGVLRPIRGFVKINGKLSFASHTHALPQDLRVLEALEFFKDLIGGNVEDVVRIFGLNDLLQKKISTLSMGQKRRVSLAKSFLIKADVYLLDEPTDNLDPIWASNVRKVVFNLSKEKIILYTTHNLYEAKDLATHVILLDKGRIKLSTPIDKLNTGRYDIGIKASGDLSKILVGEYRGEYFVLSVSDPSGVNRIIQHVTSQGIQIYEVREMGNPLEDLLK
ncbi:heme ABC transporter [Candidatus Marsarchaeota G2 archaeon ECH_B_1]|jgi:ABC-type multidrug transport system, ATPase component|uniref:Heme ABC transporter n=1 Tax=Candidatus Marsarchaeota G2 archaeon ECH_B_1 TaxID=1978159 RepID=A0A2R6BIU8_9ARCH|nr:MAG: heme ABC transporter [Candidatus Marsarchaeota G2 archaeon ECH_B_1]